MIKRLLAHLGKKDSGHTGNFYDAAQHPVRKNAMSKNAVAVVEQLVNDGYHAYLVGGCIRDVLLGKHPKDFDVATDATPEQVKRLFRRSRIIGRRFQIVHVYFGREVIEVTTFRGHHSAANSSKQAVQSASGMLLRDNVYGSIEEDAVRRDFTANSLYFDPLSETLIDFTGGLQDIEAGRLVTIGDPKERFREDPVRMLRAIRFESKLGLRLDPKSAKQLLKSAHYIRQVSSARLFDEIVKLFMSGHAEHSLEPLIESGLFAILFPSTAVQLDHEDNICKPTLAAALHNTDQRIGLGKPVTPAFLYAALLWPATAVEMTKILSLGKPIHLAINKAANKVISEQIEITQIPKRFSVPMREIWELHLRLHQRGGKRAEKLLALPRFRAAYDFVLLREQAGENMNGLGQWWTDYQNASVQEREEMTSQIGGNRRQRRRSKNRRRKPRTNEGESSR